MALVLVLALAQQLVQGKQLRRPTIQRESFDFTVYSFCCPFQISTYDQSEEGDESQSEFHVDFDCFTITIVRDVNG